MGEGYWNIFIFMWHLEYFVLSLLFKPHNQPGVQEVLFLFSKKRTGKGMFSKLILGDTVGKWQS
jgi:hypothetical protein